MRPEVGSSAAHTGATWLCSEQQTTGMPLRTESSRPSSLLGMPGCGLARRVGQLHHVRVRLGGEPETAGQVHVEDVEASGAESEVARLRVHDHLVAERDRARQPWVRNAGRPVHLDPRQAVVALQHRGDRAAAEAKRHAPPPAGRA